MSLNSSTKFQHCSQLINCSHRVEENISNDGLPPAMEYFTEIFLSEVLFQYWGRIAAALLTIILVKLAFRPINRVKGLTDVGWSYLFQSQSSERNKADLVRQVQRMRKIGDLPPVYPNGWFAIEETRNIQVGKVKSIQCLGETLAAFRAEDGQVHVLDAYCPHLGANMAVGGVVKGNCLECPFHGWKFDGKSGSCSDIPYSKKVPDIAKVKKWRSKECNGYIFIWFDAEGRDPLWKMPIIEEIESGKYHYRGRTQHQILAHIQEIAENGSDLAHLNHLHVPNVLKGADLLNTFPKNRVLDVIEHEWNGIWKPLESPRGHVASIELCHRFSLFGGRLKLLEMLVSIEQIGPGLVVLWFDTIFGKGVLVQTVTPQEPLRQRVVHQFYSSSSLIAPLANFIILGEAFQVERDIMIWNSKQFLSKPLLVSEDKLISRFRRWYGQFYSENSPKMEFFRKDNLQW